MADEYNNQFKENEWAYFLIPKIDLSSRDKDFSISTVLSSNIKKAPLIAVVNFLLKNFSDKYPKAVEGLGVKQNSTKVELAGQIVDFVQLSRPQFCLVCKTDYLPFSQNDSADGDSGVKCFVCQTPAHAECVNETTISEDQGIVFLCNNCIQRKKAEQDQDKSIHLSPSKTPQESDSSSEESSKTPVQSESSSEDSSSNSEYFSPRTKKKKKRKSLENTTVNKTKHTNQSKVDTSKKENKEESTTKKVSKDEKDKLKKDEICPLLLEGKCPHGISGKSCEYKHKRYCFRFCGFGDQKNHRAGCRFGKDCRYLHPKLCQNSVVMRACYNKQCTLTHLKFTRKKDDNYRNDNNRETNRYNRTDTRGRSQDQRYTPKTYQSEPKDDDKPKPWAEGSALYQPNSTEKPKKDGENQRFLDLAMESMKKELSNLISVQIQQQMQLQQQVQQMYLQKFFPQPHQNLLLPSHQQMNLTGNQKVPSPVQAPTAATQAPLNQY